VAHGRDPRPIGARVVLEWDVAKRQQPARNRRQALKRLAIHAIRVQCTYLEDVQRFPGTDAPG
jgi:hypothetical protein